LPFLLGSAGRESPSKLADALEVWPDKIRSLPPRDDVRVMAAIASLLPATVMMRW
jgi:hypothetical protein